MVPMSKLPIWALSLFLNQASLKVAMTETPDRSSRAAKSELAGRVMGGQLEPFATSLIERVQAAIPVYAQINHDELLPAAVATLTLIFSAIREERQFTVAELTDLRDHGEKRGRQGISIEEMLIGWRLAIRAAMQTLTTIGRDNGVTDADLLDLSHEILALTDTAIISLVRGHHYAERELANYEKDRLTDLLRGILFGTLSRAEIRIRIESYGLDLDGNYHAIRARVTTHAPFSDLTRLLGLSPGGNAHGLTALIDGDLAGFVHQRPKCNADTAVGLGPPARLDRFETSFSRATRAMTTAAAFQLTGVYDLGQLGLLPAVLDQQEIGDELVHRYLAPLGTGEGAQTLIDTLRCYLSTGMRADIAAEQLFVHHNTVRYRLRRYEQLTGINLHDPDHSLQAWWALQRVRLNSDSYDKTGEGRLA